MFRFCLWVTGGQGIRRAARHSPQPVVPTRYVPHVAVRGEHRATVALDTGEVLAGRLPPKLHRSVREFLSEHRNDAFASWEAVRRGEPSGRIPYRR
ncbi:MAG: DUF4160 domain-containing protein [Pseudonocardiales bacterium]